ncbi:DgyrCDS8033 [Dimorphilus gyrociliatus]|uniref:non-specific serine/threonine protein kinase n=1 Tax=Dimorphilus gyrociliatus TaxID=2664684 RepID=A0A7I8VSZ1_9ANNE|nr:DgyrCDS8033 [Dimorphilus gyrociliatus]
MNDFTKELLLGAGTFGKAWLCTRNSTGRKYVLKQVDCSRLCEKKREQAITEVKAMAICKNINIVRYKQAFVDNCNLCIIMEYCTEGDLQQKIDNQRGIFFDINDIFHWFIQITLAIKYIHDKNILHRDLKTHNIFLTSHNVIKVGDFGIAKMLESDQDYAITAIGTPYFLSPEICQKLPYRKSSDIWSLGCVLFNICCLKPPFEGNNLSGLVMAILKGEYEPISPYFGPILEDLIAVLLNQDAELRPTASQILSVSNLRPYLNSTIKKLNLYCSSNVPASPFSPIVKNSPRLSQKSAKSVPSARIRPYVNGDLDFKVDNESFIKKRRLLSEDKLKESPEVDRKNLKRFKNFDTFLIPKEKLEEEALNLMISTVTVNEQTAFTNKKIITDYLTRRLGIDILYQTKDDLRKRIVNVQMTADRLSEVKSSIKNTKLNDKLLCLFLRLLQIEYVFKV